MTTKKTVKIFKIVGLILLIGISGFVIWAYTPPKPLDEALNALNSTDNVEITKNGNYYLFKPKLIDPTKGFIIYPGGRVDPRSYSPTALALAEKGYLVVLMIMPFNLAVTSISAAKSIPAQFENIEKWAIGGHSLGGAMAAQYVSQNPDSMDGLIFWASYPATNLSDSTIKVLSIYSTLDGLSSLEDRENSKSNLPSTTIWVEIVGGNHAYFGYYGDQSGDNAAEISRDVQQQQIVEATANFLSDL
jgi:hypothetical protein